MMRYLQNPESRPESNRRLLFPRDADVCFSDYSRSWVIADCPVRIKNWLSERQSKGHNDIVGNTWAPWKGNREVESGLVLSFANVSALSWLYFK